MVNVIKLRKDHIPNPNRREKIGRLLTNFNKFAVDYAVNVSSKGVADGKKVYKIVQEGFKSQPPLLSLNDKTKSKDIESMEEMHAKTEEMQEGLNNLKQQNEISAELVEGSNTGEKIPDEGIKGSNLLKTKERRIFIRSRL